MMAKEVARTNRALLGRGVMWDESGPDIEWMRLCIRLKLEQYPHFATLLAATGDAMLVEDCTTHPRESAEFWGAVRRGNHWHGKNVLGCLWMEMREGRCPRFTSAQLQNQQYALCSMGYSAGLSKTS
jgi:predicted NAD-dependent protein-ADP-ribosyltransferase YbiA (DUF1768 family)